MEPYERQLWAAGARLVCGIDEAGRGPLAGRVYAAAVILPRQAAIKGLADSKKLSERQREELYPQIIAQAKAYCIAWADEKEVDKINILQASLLAMKRAYEGLSLKPDATLVDGNRVPGLLCPVLLPIVKGDSLCASIAAASILAKVARDRYMLALDRLYPEYGFAQHKGYPTKLHYERIRENGICPVHRRTFLRKLPAGMLTP